MFPAPTEDFVIALPVYDFEGSVERSSGSRVLSLLFCFICRVSFVFVSGEMKTFSMLLNHRNHQENR